MHSTGTWTELSKLFLNCSSNFTQYKFRNSARLYYVSTFCFLTKHLVTYRLLFDAIKVHANPVHPETITTDLEKAAITAALKEEEFLSTLKDQEHIQGIKQQSTLSPVVREKSERKAKIKVKFGAVQHSVNKHTHFADPSIAEVLDVQNKIKRRARETEETANTRARKVNPKPLCFSANGSRASYSFIRSGYFSQIHYYSKIRSQLQH